MHPATLIHNLSPSPSIFYSLFSCELALTHPSTLFFHSLQRGSSRSGPASRFESCSWQFIIDSAFVILYVARVHSVGVIMAFSSDQDLTGVSVQSITF